MSMNIAKISSTGQLTLPVEIRRKLAIKDGDKIMFFEKNGEIILSNSSLLAIREAQAALVDIDVSEDDALLDVMELRYGKGGGQ